MPVIASSREAKVGSPMAAKDDQDPETQDAKVPLMGSSDSLVQHLSPDPFSVDAEHIDAEATGGMLQARAALPCEFAATLSDSYTQGQTFTIQGPCGPIKVEPPKDAEPGMTLRYRLAPTPDYRVQVPPGGKPGDSVTFQRADGVEITVRVPEGQGPGDTFDVTPPALMVRVPDGAEKGDFLVFSFPSPPNQPTEWFRAQVPEGLSPGKFFSARLPMPKMQRATPPPKGGWSAAWKAIRSEIGFEVRDTLQLLRTLRRPAPAEGDIGSMSTGRWGSGGA